MMIRLVFLISLIPVFSHVNGTQLSCASLGCNIRYDKSRACQCNRDCPQYNNCCSDYNHLCNYSCKSRCGESYDKDNNCQCNSNCGNYNNCCNDYSSECNNQNAAPVTDEDLRSIGNTLWYMDENALPVSAYSLDRRGRLFNHLDETYLDTPTFRTLKALLDNYNPTIGVSDLSSSFEIEEQNSFLDAITGTTVMEKAREFLASKGLAGSTMDQFKEELRQYWFHGYNRKSGNPAIDSSGFEHVFSGEIASDKVSGLHNWLSYYLKEQSGDVTNPYVQEFCADNILRATYYWDNKSKPAGSMFHGTSPEFDMAIYTICFLARPNQSCTTSLENENEDVSIKTYQMQKGGDKVVASAYVEC